MTFATRVTFRGTGSSPALRAYVLERAQRLQRFAGDIRSCDVVVAVADGHHRSGHHFDVHARVLMRGRAIEAASSPEATSRNEDAYTAVSNVFNALRRRVEDYVRRRRGDFKARA